MFHNGSMKDNLNFQTICSLKQQEQSALITYEDGWNGIRMGNDGKLMMEEYRGTSIKQALQDVGVHSRVCSYWEIYKLLFLLHNVKPDLVEVNITNDNENFDKVSIFMSVAI